jgi:hypothetical protein
MALHALSRMGATDERLKDYFHWWEENRALPRDNACQIARCDWRQYLGRTAKFAALSATFRDWIAGCGSEEVIEAVFPALSDGVGAAAFHGLIRLAYGIEADHAGEIAAALAGLCARYDDLGLLYSRPAQSPGVGVAFTGLAEALGGASFTGQGIIGKMGAAVSDRRFAAAFSRPSISAALLPGLARISIALYWQTAEFTVLHMVT